MTHLPNFHSDHLVVPVPAAELARLRASNAALLAALTRIAEGKVMTVHRTWTHADTVIEYQRIARHAIAAAQTEDWHDDKPDGRPDLHTSTQPGDLDAFGRTLKPGR